MKITIEKEIEHCNHCPYFKEYIDTSVCFDSFDEPNYDWYCLHPDAYNCNKNIDIVSLVLGDGKPAILIGGSYHRELCDIPDWCPFKNIN